ncbi:hypothetical protein AB3S75_016210 [Citrus x aurantiifolia]
MAVLLLKNSGMALILFSCLLLSVYSMASAQNHGTATYYTPPYIPSACYGFADQGVMIAAASEAIWNGGGACGQYYQVTCVSGTNRGTPNPCQGSSSEVVKIVDLCPARSCRGTIDS